MQTVIDMLRASPQTPSIDEEALAECIAACATTAQATTACADACLATPTVATLRRCVRMCLDCADVCAATERILSRQCEPDLELMRAQVETLAAYCRNTGDECARYAATYEACRLCVEACRRCESCAVRVLQIFGQLGATSMAASVPVE